MTGIAEFTLPRTLTLPADVAARFRPSDRFIVWVDGDMLYLKRITPPAVTEIVAHAPEGEPLSMMDISALVHQTRDRP